MKKRMANVLTGMRILCGFLILCFPAFSEWFYFFYLLGGFTDAVDGTIARKTGAASDFGSKFDTIADFLFAAAVAVKIIRALSVPLWLILWIGMIALIKIGCHLAGYIRHHEFKTVHSTLNKVCGGAVFIVPLFFGGNAAWQGKAAAVTAVCILTTIAAIAEGITILRNATDEC